MKALFLSLAAVCGWCVAADSGWAQGTAFSYQGRLNSGGSPAFGIYDLRFTIYDSTNLPGNVVVGPITNLATGVTNGLFTTALNFGSNVFTGSERWLEIAVRTNGAATFVTLSPRQQLTPTPYAVFANTAGTANSASNLSGTVSSGQVSRLLYFASGDSVVEGTGAITGRSVTFTKMQTSSRLRITYTDNLGIENNASGTSVNAFWEVRLDGASITTPAALIEFLYNQVGSVDLFQPATMVGYATGIAAGPHTLAVYAYTVPANLASVGIFTGDESSYLLEVEEIP